MLQTEKKEIENIEALDSAAELNNIELETTEVKNNTDIDDGGEMDLLNDLRKATDKDLDKTTVQNDNNNNIDTPSTTVINTPQKTNIVYQNHELVAQLTVAALNVAMGMLLQFISDNWSEEAEKKYTLSPTRKKEILEPLTLVLQQSKSKYNPVVILVITVLVSYVPMFISAFRERKENKNKQRVKKNILNNEGQQVKNENKEPELTETKKEQVKTVEVFKMTEGQKKRLREIKAKRGKRSASDILFIKEMGLDGFV